MKIQIRSNVINGKLNRNRNLLIDAIQSFEGKEISITIEKAKKQRSNQQNRYMWSVIIPIVKNCLKSAGNVFSDEQTHELLKYKFLKETILIKEDTGEFVERIKSSTELSTSQMMDYFASIREWVLDFWGVEIPEPNQEIFLNFDE
jgi:hypothetical protein